MPPWDTDEDVLPAGGYACLPCYYSTLLPPLRSTTQLEFQHQCWIGWHELVQDGQGGVVLPSGTGPRSLPTTYPNLYNRDVSICLIHADTTALVSSMHPVDMILSLLEYPNMPQYPLPWPLLCGMYPSLGTFSQKISVSVTHSSCGMINSGGTLFHQSA